jgi:hypothetical protein
MINARNVIVFKTFQYSGIVLTHYMIILKQHSYVIIITMQMVMNFIPCEMLNISDAFTLRNQKTFGVQTVFRSQTVLSCGIFIKSKPNKNQRISYTASHVNSERDV